MNKNKWEERFDKKMFLNDLLLDYSEYAFAQAGVKLSAGDLQEEAILVGRRVFEAKKEFKSFISTLLEEQKIDNGIETDVLLKRQKEEFRKTVPKKRKSGLKFHNPKTGLEIEMNEKTIHNKGYNQALTDILKAFKDL